MLTASVWSDLGLQQLDEKWSARSAQLEAKQLTAGASRYVRGPASPDVEQSEGTCDLVLVISALYQITTRVLVHHTPRAVTFCSTPSGGTKMVGSDVSSAAGMTKSGGSLHFLKILRFFLRPGLATSSFDVSRAGMDGPVFFKKYAMSKVAPALVEENALLLPSGPPDSWGLLSTSGLGIPETSIMVGLKERSRCGG
jgi:hypothetical protein